MNDATEVIIMKLIIDAIKILRNIPEHNYAIRKFLDAFKYRAYVL